MKKVNENDEFLSFLSAKIPIYIYYIITLNTIKDGCTD